MKEQKANIVTKSALGDDINFEKICKKPDSNVTERAIARLPRHPLLKEKTDVLKACVKACKGPRQIHLRMLQTKITPRTLHIQMIMPLSYSMKELLSVSKMTKKLKYWQ